MIVDRYCGSSCTFVITFNTEYTPSTDAYIYKFILIKYILHTCFCIPLQKNICCKWLIVSGLTLHTLRTIVCAGKKIYTEIRQLM